MDQQNLGGKDKEKSSSNTFSHFEEQILNIYKTKNLFIELANENEIYINEKIEQYLEKDLTVERILNTMNNRGIKRQKDLPEDFFENLILEIVKSINDIVEEKVYEYNDEILNNIEAIECNLETTLGFKIRNCVDLWFVSGFKDMEGLGALGVYKPALEKNASILTKFGVSKASSPALFTRFSEFEDDVSLVFASKILSFISNPKLNLRWKKGAANQIRKTSLEITSPQIKKSNKKLWNETKMVSSIGFDEIIRKSQINFIEAYRDTLNKEEINKIYSIINVESE